MHLGDDVEEFFENIDTNSTSLLLQHVFGNWLNLANSTNPAKRQEALADLELARVAGPEKCPVFALSAAMLSTSPQALLEAFAPQIENPNFATRKPNHYNTSERVTLNGRQKRR